MEPHQYPKRILLSVTGLSPQLLTETVYALARQVEPPFLPTEVHLLTTAAGAEQARRTLLGGNKDWFHRLCAEYELHGIRFSEDDIHVIRGSKGEPLEDIRTPQDNEQAADAIVRFVGRLTRDPNSALHVSMAGGRKTMGYYAGYALSLYGREQDRLSHVLVSTPFEGHPEFFYPTVGKNIIDTRDNPPLALDTSQAKVELAMIPFVRMRNGLDESLRLGKTSFHAAVAAAQRSLGLPELTIDPKRNLIRCAQTTIELRPTERAFLGWLAQRAKEGRPGVARNRISDEEVREFLDIYSFLPRASTKTAKALSKGMEPRFVDERVTHLRKRLVRYLASAAEPYCIRNDKRRPVSRYFLGLAPDQIRFEPIDTAPASGRRASRPVKKK